MSRLKVARAMQLFARLRELSKLQCAYIGCFAVLHKPKPRRVVQKVREVGTSNGVRQVAGCFALQSRRSQRCGFWPTRQNAKQVPTSRTFCTASTSPTQAIRGRMPGSNRRHTFLPICLPGSLLLLSALPFCATGFKPGRAGHPCVW